MGQELRTAGARGTVRAGQFGDRGTAQVSDELVGALAGQLGIVELVEAPRVLGHGPGQRGVRVGIASDQSGVESIVCCGCEPLGAAQHSQDAVERVAGAAAMSGDVLLNAPVDLVDTDQAESGEMEGVQRTDRVGQLGGQVIRCSENAWIMRVIEVLLTGPVDGRDRVRGTAAFEASSAVEPWLLVDGLRRAEYRLAHVGGVAQHAPDHAAAPSGLADAGGHAPGRQPAGHRGHDRCLMLDDLVTGAGLGGFADIPVGERAPPSTLTDSALAR